jgi:iron complex outermembrane receptor protein
MRTKQSRFAPVAVAMAAAGASALACQVHAQTPAKPAVEQTLGDVTVRGVADPGTLKLDDNASTATRLGVTIRETPASVEVIDSVTIAERGKRTVAEAIEGGVGLTVGTPGGSPGSVTSRGFTDGSVRYLYDGIPLIDSGMVTRPGGTFNIDRIEVLRGPASVLHGMQGIGSAVNFVSRAAAPVEQPLDVEIGLGNQNARRFGLGKGGRIGDSIVSYRADVSTNRFDTFVSGNRHEYERLTGSLRFDFSRQLSLTLQADKLRDRQEDAYWGTPLNNGRIDTALRNINYNNLTDNVFSGDTTWLRATLDWKPNDAWEIRNSLYHYDSFRNWRNVESYAYNAAARTVTRSSYGDLDHDHRMTGNRLDLLHKGTLFGMKNRFAFGFDMNRTEFLGQRNGFPGTQTVNAFAPPESSFFAPTGVIGKFPARDVSINQWAVYAENQLSVTERLKLVAGLRLDDIDASFVRTDNGAVQIAPVNFAKRWTPVGTRGGFVYDISRDLTWYGQLTSATEPVGTLLLLTQTNFNYNLTRGRMLESGFKGNFWDRKGEWSAAAYRIVKSDVLVPITPAITEQAGQQSSRGIELSVGVRPTPALKLEANAAILKARFDVFNENVAGVTVSRAGKQPQNVPEQVFNLGARYKFVPQVEGSAWIRHVGKRYTDTANLIEMPAYSVLDLSLGYRIDRKSELQFWVRNAADKLYAQYRGASNSQVILGAPRSVELVYRGSF